MISWRRAARAASWLLMSLSSRAVRSSVPAVEGGARSEGARSEGATDGARSAMAVAAAVEVKEEEEDVVVVVVVVDGEVSGDGGARATAIVQIGGVCLAQHGA